VLTLLPPESVPLHFALSGLGVRMGAQLIDLLLSMAAIFVVAFLGARFLEWEALSLLMLLLFFAVRTPYYIASELMWNGQTLGKRLLGIRVVASDGTGLTTHAVVVRNLMREAEVFGPAIAVFGGFSIGGLWTLVMLIWIVVVFVVPLRDKQGRRLGDLIAGTCVILVPTATRTTDLAAAPVASGAGAARFTFATEHLEHYGRYELQVLEALLHVKPKAVKVDDELLRVTRRIVTRIDYRERVADADVHDFLSAFYTAQRGHLEQRRLFGDVREDKFHGKDRKAESGGPGHR
jgi:uncharacterized RDD family membrane protein YckC